SLVSPLHVRLLHTLDVLWGVVVLMPAGLIDDEKGDRLDPLVGVEALPALQALPAAAHRLADLRVPGVHDLQVVVSAVRTAHARASAPKLPKYGSAGTPGCSGPRPR